MDNCRQIFFLFRKYLKNLLIIFWHRIKGIKKSTESLPAGLLNVVYSESNKGNFVNAMIYGLFNAIDNMNVENVKINISWEFEVLC